MTENDLLKEIYNVKDYNINVLYCGKTQEIELITNFLTLYDAFDIIISASLIVYEDLPPDSQSLNTGMLIYSFLYIIIEISQVIFTPYYNGFYKLIFSSLFSLSFLVLIPFLIHIRFSRKSLVNPYLNNINLNKQLLDEPIMRAYFTEYLRKNEQEMLYILIIYLEYHFI